MSNSIRVRFAPSPTGPLHMGGVRTALYNYLFAKKVGGTFVLRIEDTDQTRYVANAEQYIMDSLKWCGISPDESPENPGAFGPYRQSERKAMYMDYALELVEKGWAYYAFDSSESIAEKRAEVEKNGQTFQYDASSRKQMKNSESLSTEETEKLKADGNWVIRFKMPDDVTVKFQDLIRGDVQFESKLLDDKVLMKADGMPTYHLANIVDDHLMEISHVIRGEEWLPSAPLHQLLYQAFGWTAPQFAHLPLILKPTGNGKLSKRDGQRGGFPVFPLAYSDEKSGETLSGYREYGYLPEAFLNMLLMLGWNPGTEQELFSLEEAVEAFSLERVVKSGARFNPEKAAWFNEQHLRGTSVDELAEALLPKLKDEGYQADIAKAKEMVNMLLERVQFLHEMNDASYLFEAPTAFDAKTKKKKWKERTPEIITGLWNALSGIADWNAKNIETTFKGYMVEKELGFGQILPGFRLLLTGLGGGPSVFEIAAFIGKEEAEARISNGLEIAKEWA